MILSTGLPSAMQRVGGGSIAAGGGTGDAIGSSGAARVGPYAGCITGLLHRLCIQGAIVANIIDATTRLARRFTIRRVTGSTDVSSTVSQSGEPLLKGASPLHSQRVWLGGQWPDAPRANMIITSV